MLPLALCLCIAIDSGFLAAWNLEHRHTQVEQLMQIRDRSGTCLTWGYLAGIHGISPSRNLSRCLAAGHSSESTPAKWQLGFLTCSLYLLPNGFEVAVNILISLGATRRSEREQASTQCYLHIREFRREQASHNLRHSHPNGSHPMRCFG